MIEASYIEMDEIPPDGLEQWLCEGKGLLWIAEKDGKIIAALTTSLVNQVSGLVCRMVACGGTEMDRWKEREAQIVEYAKAEGCVKVTAEGRKGWARVLPGYEIKRVYLEKRL